MDAIIDTGFTGFLSAPETTLAEIGFRGHAEVPFHFATGERILLLVAKGDVQLESGEIHAGRIVFGKGPDVLLGMDFLRRARKALYVDSKYTALLDEDELRELTAR